MKASIVDLLYAVLIAYAVFILASIPARLREHEDAKFKADVERPFRAHGVKL